MEVGALRVGRRSRAASLVEAQLSLCSRSTSQRLASERCHLYGELECRWHKLGSARAARGTIHELLRRLSIDRSRALLMVEAEIQKKPML